LNQHENLTTTSQKETNPKMSIVILQAARRSLLNLSSAALSSLMRTAHARTARFFAMLLEG